MDAGVAVDQGHSVDDLGVLIKIMANMITAIFTDRKSQFPMAYFLVQSLAFLSASASFVFHSSATSFANGSSGFGAERRA